MDKNDIEQIVEDMQSASTFPLRVDQALQGRGYVKSNSKGWSGTFYVAATSAGSPTHLVTVKNGIITSVS